MLNLNSRKCRKAGQNNGYRSPQAKRVTMGDKKMVMPGQWMEDNESSNDQQPGYSDMLQ